MNLGVEATLSDILTRLDSVYGLVDRTEAILAEFYSARQKPTEDVSSWSCRLEDIMCKVRQIKDIDSSEKDSMLHNMLWIGLEPSLKNITRYLFDSIQRFDELRVALRRVEQEHKNDRDNPVENRNSMDQKTGKPKPPKRKKSVQNKDTSDSVIFNDMQISVNSDMNNPIVNTQDNSETDIETVSASYVSHNSPNHSSWTASKHDDEPVCFKCGQHGHIAIGCRVITHRKRRPYYTQESRKRGYVHQQYMQSSKTYNKKSSLIGECNEVSIKVFNIATTALLDTGSTVSTISETFYKEHFPEIPLQSLEFALSVECADGQQLPYSGYISLEIQISGISSFPLLNDCLFLVVPQSDYNSKVPVLIGTNLLGIIMETTKDMYGYQFLQKADMHTPWYLSMRCLVMRERELSKNRNILAFIKSAENRKITIPANSEVVINGYLDKKVLYEPVCAIIQPTSSSFIPDDLDISPTLVTYDCQKTELVPIHITNISTRTVTVPPKALLCELQPVTVESHRSSKEQKLLDTDIMEKTKIDDSNLNATEFQKRLQLIRAFNDIFSKNDEDIGLTARVKHQIELTNPVPFKQRHRKIPLSMIDEVRNHIQQLLTSGVIRRSKSPWASNVVLVRKKNGQLRMCIDYRQLNQRTVKDAYALPRIDDILDSLHGNRYFTVLDMKSGYHQIEIEENHKERTAFTVGPLGFFEYERMPFGLANAPATYQRLMEDIFADLNLSICIIYLDDIIVFSRTFEDHLERLERVLQRIQNSGLKLSPSKCQFFQTKGIEPDPEKVDKVKSWPTPRTPEEVRKFLGFIGYYRKFVRNFSKLARPLTDLTPSPQSSKKKGKQQSSVNWRWGREQQEAFDVLRQHLISPPILGYPDMTIPFELHTDASSKGLGAILYQEQAGMKRVIGYASRGLTPAERNYPAHKLEFLALKWSITEKFKDYLYGSKFTAITDNNPLTYILSNAKLDATGHRWVAVLSAYDFDIKYRPGKNNAAADALSRLEEPNSAEMVTISSDSISTINKSQTTPCIETISFSE
ncbi:uncharacterized protein LOC130053684 [Ostrea edulis]|uniref:uncharacterized protein LOC130053684 n=1 Tax=Ostrea edulis TaxID=37623 RepID=UPI0024AF2B21|nr:uncharacterized protein LOC130053684 [Ostrea edulis]